MPLSLFLIMPSAIVVGCLTLGFLMTYDASTVMHKQGWRGTLLGAAVWNGLFSTVIVGASAFNHLHTLADGWPSAAYETGFILWTGASLGWLLWYSRRHRGSSPLASAHSTTATPPAVEYERLSLALSNDPETRQQMEAQLLETAKLDPVANERFLKERGFTLNENGALVNTREKAPAADDRQRPTPTDPRQLFKL